MEIIELSQSSPAESPWRNAAAELIRSLGTPRFESELFRVAADTSWCAHFSIFSIAERESPQVLLACNSDFSAGAKEAAGRYASLYWNDDPSNRLPLSDNRKGIIVRCMGDELSRLPYRRELYSSGDWPRFGARLIDRLALVGQSGGHTIKISFHRDSDTGPFSNEVIDRLSASADLLFALVARHFSLELMPKFGNGLTLYRRLLQDCCPDLSERQAEVCSGIALGMTSEAIALTLGLQVNTVHTYRKRAYARLSICSQNQLMKLIFNAAMKRGSIAWLQ